MGRFIEPKRKLKQGITKNMDFFISLALYILRLAVGIIFLTHGKAKLAKQTPSNFRYLGYSEIAAALILILGLGWLTQIAALWLVVVMSGAIYFKKYKWHTPFVAMDKMGWEFDLILLAANLVILASGGGTFGLFQ